LHAVGNVAFNERDRIVVQARSSGFVERLYVRAPLETVRRGQPLLELYVPDWVAAQEEYLAVRRMGANLAAAGLLDAALQRMRLAGMSDAQIRQVAERGQVLRRVTLTAPQAGVVTELAAREGMTVAPGAPLFALAGLDSVWVNAEVPQGAAAQVRPGTPARATTDAYPGTGFSGKVEALLPQVNPATRTLVARIELANPGHKLTPGLFVSVALAPQQAKQALLVPTEAVIQTGQRTVVITALGDGRFAPAEVTVGAESNGETEVLSGLAAGQQVVASGQFLIDSEASLRGALQRLGEGKAQAGQTAPAAPTHHGVGKIEHVAGDEVTISHQPIPSLKWGPMTMGFVLPASGLPRGLSVGDTVAFDFRQADGGRFQIVAITRADRQNGDKR
jgi:Cu(I)/Ag(I) efflux system membrane fusion protein